MSVENVEWKSLGRREMELLYSCKHADWKGWRPTTDFLKSRGCRIDASRDVLHLAYDITGETIATKSPKEWGWQLMPVWPVGNGRTRFRVKAPSVKD